MKVTIVGVGVMGGGMARRLIERGHAVTAFDTQAERLVGLAELGVSPMPSAAEAALASDYVITSLPDDAAVRSAIAGPRGVLDGARRGTMIIETSTVSPDVVRELAEAAHARGCSIVDAAADRAKATASAETLAGSADTGGIAAGQGQIRFFVGGTDEAVRHAGHILAELGSSYQHIGPLGAGVSAKIISNAVVAVQTAFLGEMLALVKGLGLDASRIVAALARGSADSETLRHQITQFALLDEFPEGKFPVRYMLKDLGLCRALGADAGVEVAVLDAAIREYQGAQRAGFTELYFPSVARYLQGPRVPEVSP